MIKMFMFLSKLIKNGKKLTVIPAIAGSYTVIHYAEIGSSHIVLINQQFAEYEIDNSEDLLYLFDHKLVHGMNTHIIETKFKVELDESIVEVEAKATIRTTPKPIFSDFINRKESPIKSFKLVRGYEDEE